MPGIKHHRFELLLIRPRDLKAVSHMAEVLWYTRQENLADERCWS